MKNIAKLISTGRTAAAEGRSQAAAGMQLVNIARKQQHKRDRLIALHRAKQSGNVIQLRRKK